MAPTTVPARTGPPEVGKTLSVKVTTGLYDDLVTLMQTGVNASDAVRAAVRQAADIHRTAWAHGVCPPDTAPIVRAYSLAAAPGWTPQSSPYDASDAPARLVTPPPYPAAGRAHTA